MAEDIAPELLEKVQSEYRKLRENDKKLAQIAKRTAAGSADSLDLNAYAEREGELLAEALRRNVSGDVLPNGRMYFNIASRVLPPVLEENYNNVADMSQEIMAGMNERAGIHIKAQRPELNTERIDKLVNIAAQAEKYDDWHKEVESNAMNFSQSVGADTIRTNADFQYKSGFSPKVHRTAESGCCKWCQALEGTYDYWSVKDGNNDVWHRHLGCRCVIEYDPGNGRIQNAHSKQWRQADADGSRARRIEYDQAAAGSGERFREKITENQPIERMDPRQREINAVIKLGADHTEKSGNTYREELERIDYKDAEEAIKFYGNAIRNMPIEHAVIIQRDGRVFHFWGDEKSVVPFGVDFREAYATHNHPSSNGIKSFGQDDFVVIQSNPDIARLECVNEKYNYSVKPLETIKNISYHVIMLEAYDYADVLDDADVQHAAMMLLNDGGYVIYERRRSDGGIP